MKTMNTKHLNLLLNLMSRFATTSVTQHDCVVNVVYTVIRHWG